MNLLDKEWCGFGNAQALPWLVTGNYLDDPWRLRALLPQAARLTFAVLACRPEPLPNMAALADLRKATWETGQRMHDALLDGPLFGFGEAVVQTATR